MPKPVIGLTTSRMLNPTGRFDFGTNIAYPKSIADAGSLPVLIPFNISNDDLDQLLYRVDGFLFTGGYDVDPRGMVTISIPKSRGLMRIATVLKYIWSRY
jgi:putative glutamine amidotransferase